jgi:hypothetical protein
MTACRCFLLAACLGLATVAAGAQQGLVLPEDEAPWPRWQWRAQSLLGPTLPADPLWAGVRGGQGLRLAGDYVFYDLRTPGGGFSAALRATGALTLTERAGGFGGIGGSEPGLKTQPFLGLGISGVWPRSGWGLSAELGIGGHGEGLRWRPERQGWALDDIVRDLRLTPTLQIGLTYAF